MIPLPSDSINEDKDDDIGGLGRAETLTIFLHWSVNGR